MQLNLEIGKLYTAQGFVVLKQSSGDWHGVRNGEILMPIETFMASKIIPSFPLSYYQKME